MNNIIRGEWEQLVEGFPIPIIKQIENITKAEIMQIAIWGQRFIISQDSDLTVHIFQNMYIQSTK